jgi:post-segregation antitoxin (ccd killing protein)
MNLHRTKAAKRSVNLTLSDDLLTRARAAGLNLSALAEEAVGAALARRERERVQAEITQACAVHDQYLAEYGSLGEAVRANGE